MNMARIKELRTQLHLSQEYVANYLGLSRSTYTQMENGKRKVLADEVAKLSDLFGVSADSLLNNTNVEYIETIDFAIDASNGGTNYYVGFRNGLRYVKSLIDGKEPQFENCAEQEPSEYCSRFEEE